jgi:hypothetical protein
MAEDEDIGVALLFGKVDTPEVFILELIIFP